MQTEIEEFLRKHSPRSFSASEVADVMKISRSSAQRQLKKLAASGRISYVDGRYLCQGQASPKELQLQAKIDSLARLTGFPREVIDAWVEGIKAKKKRKGA